MKVKLLLSFIFSIVIIIKTSFSYSSDFLIRTIALSGDTAPETNGLKFSDFGGSPLPALNDDGMVAFLGFLDTNTRGIWKGATELSVVVLEGEAVPGIEGATFGYGLMGPSLNNLGNTAFYATLSGISAGVVQSIWREEPQLTLIVRTGDIAPGTDGRTFSEMEWFNAPALNDHNQVAFNAIFSEPNIVFGVQNHGIWKTSPDLSLVVKVDDFAPDTTGRTFKHMAVSTKGINNAGNIAFHGFLSDGLNRNGIWKETPSLALVVRQGDNPADPPDANFQSFIPTVPINNSGNTAFLGGLRLFVGDVTTNNNYGIWKESSEVNLIIRKNDQVPDLGGVVFYHFSYGGIDKTISPAINDAGDLAFSAILRGNNITDANDGSIWLKSNNFFTQNNAPQLVVREGDKLEVKPGDIRIVKDLLETGGFGPHGFNNCREIAFKAQFTDSSSGIFVASDPSQPDTDNDGRNNVCDTDDDDDDVLDINDNCSLISNPDQKDMDEDGTGDVCDTNFPWAIFMPAIIGNTGKTEKCNDVAGHYNGTFWDNCPGFWLEGQINVDINSNCSFSGVSSAGVNMNGTFSTVNGNVYSGTGQTDASGCGQFTISCTNQRGSISCQYTYDNGGGYIYL